MSDGTGAIDGLMHRLLTADMAGTRALLEAHGALLLSDEAEGWLKAQAAAAGDDADTRQALAWHLGLIQACRQDGINAVFQHIDTQTASHNQAQKALDELRALEGSDSETLLRQVEICEELLESVERSTQPDLWAELQLRLGAALHAFGQDRGNAEFLVGAVEAYRSAVLEYSKSRRPADWKMIQDRLESAFGVIDKFRGEADFLDAEDSYLYSYEIDRVMKRFAEAPPEGKLFEFEAEPAILTSTAAVVWLRRWISHAEGRAEFQLQLKEHLDLIQACRKHGVQAVFRFEIDKSSLWHKPDKSLMAALEGREGDSLEDLLGRRSLCERLLSDLSRDEQPVLWAHVQTCCATTLLRLGDLATDASLFERAVGAYQNALLVYTRESAPLQWTMTQTNMGAVLVRLSDTRNDEALLQAGYEAHRAALSNCFLEHPLLDWSMVQENLSRILVRLGERRKNPELLRMAAKAYESALSGYSREHKPVKWASFQIELGATLMKISELRDDPHPVTQAINAFRAALSVLTRQNAPLEWAGALNDLGIALFRYGERHLDVSSLEESISVHKSSLVEYTRDKSPGKWARAQTNIGNALLRLGEHHGDEAMLDASIRAYRAALLEYTRERSSVEWAEIQNNLGSALRVQGERLGSTDLFQEAVEAHKAALGEYNRPVTPIPWALVQSDLAVALARLGESLLDQSIVESSIDAYHAALLELTREQHIQVWAGIQNNLGTSLMILGELRDDESFYKAAVEAHHAAQLAYDRSEYPRGWAHSTTNLGIALLLLGDAQGDENAYKLAVEAHRAALLERHRENSPIDWAVSQTNLGNALGKLGKKISSQKHLEQAVEAYRAAVLEYTRERAPFKWALNQNNMGAALMSLADLAPREQVLQDAIEAFKDAALEYTRQDAPLRWAGTQVNIGQAYLKLNKLCADTTSVEAGLQAYRAALLELTPDRVPLEHIRTARNFGELLVDHGRWPEGEATLSGLLETALAAVNAAQSTAEQHRFLEALAGVGDLLAFARLRMGLFTEALAAAGRGRAVLLSAIHSADRLAGDGAQALRAALNTWRDACRRADSADAALLTSGAIDTARLEMAAVQRRNAAEFVRIAYGRYRDLLRKTGFDRVEVPSVAAMASALPEGGALAVIVLAKDRAAIVILRRHSDEQASTSPTVEVLDLPRLTINAIDTLQSGNQPDTAEPTPWFTGYGDFVRALEQGEGAVTIGASEAWNAVAEGVLVSLWDQMMRPLRDHLCGMGLAPNGEVVLCLPGRLAALPLHAAGERIPAAGGAGRTVWRCFLDDFAVSYVPSPQALLDARNRADEPGRQGSSLLAVTNPTGDPRIGVVSNPAWATFPAERRKELRHAEASIDAISAEIGFEGPGWTHLSLYCHGSFDPAEPNNTGLMMAGGASLTVRHLRSLYLPTVRLAFLGACESGMVGFALADEQIGLPASLLEAGIPAVVASHWPVSAHATRLLAEAFFRLMLQRNLRPAQALRLAQLGLRDAALMVAQGRSASVVQAVDGLLRGRPSAEGDDNDDQRGLTATTLPPPPSSLDDSIPDPRHADPIYWAAFSLTGT